MGVRERILIGWSPLLAGLAVLLAGAVEAFAAPDYDAIAQRNIFCSDCAPSSTVAMPSRRPRRHEALRPVGLLATFVDQQGRSAAALTLGGRYWQMCRVGSRLRGGVTVLAILDGYLLVRSEGAYVLVGLGDASAPSPTREHRRASSPAPRSPVDALAQRFASGVRQVAAHRFEVQRGALEHALANIGLLGRTGKIVPNVRGGKVAGFRFTHLRPNSPFTAIGLRSGDTIRAVNGREMDSLDHALDAFRQLRHASHVMIALTRGGEPLSIDYRIR